MAYSDRYDICPIPNRTIGCQALLKDKSACLYSGWLRRQSLRNKLKVFAWPHVYVIIAKGCVYCYSSEKARKPATAFTLYGYDKVFRAGEILEKEAPWSFRLVHVNSAYRSYLFSASSEREMKQWMAHIKKEMLRANGKLLRPDSFKAWTPPDGGKGDNISYQSFYNDAESASAGSVSSQDLKDIEASIYEDTTSFVLPSEYSNKKEFDESDEEMDRMVLTRPDLQWRAPLPPPVPDRPTKSKALVNEMKKLSVSQSASRGASANTEQSNQDPGKPAVNRSSKQIERNLDGSMKEDEEAREFWSSIFFYGGKEKAADIINQIADDGVYLVRVDEDSKMVLHVYGKEQSRKFQLFSCENMVTLDKNTKDCPRFELVEDLIYYYHSHPLPCVDLCLTECYLHHPAYHSIHWS